MELEDIIQKLENCKSKLVNYLENKGFSDTLPREAIDALGSIQASKTDIRLLKVALEKK